MIRFLRAAGLLAAVAAVAAAGCGSAESNRGRVKGKVTLAGKGPLTGGMITFQSAERPAESGVGPIAADGTFDVPSAPLGPCKVLVDNRHLKTGGNVMGSGPPMGGAGGMAGRPGGMPGGPPGGAGGGKAPADVGKKMNGGPPGGADAPADMGKSNSAAGTKYVPIDPAFAAAESTPLTTTVARGENTADFDVK